jgi:hypothetical protein
VISVTDMNGHVLLLSSDIESFVLLLLLQSPKKYMLVASDHNLKRAKVEFPFVLLIIFMM